MFLKNTFLIFICLLPLLIDAHPFYKTMPKEVEHIYDKLKDMEKEAIDAFKKAYPNIPEYIWEDIKFISTQTQIWLRNTAPDDIAEMKEPTVDKNCTEDEMKEYFFRYIEYECAKQDIDFEKLDLKIGFCNDVNWAAESSSQEFVGSMDGNKLVFIINERSKPTIRIDLKAFIEVLSAFNKKHALKHELTHVTEAHSAKCKIIEILVSYIYGDETLKTDVYENLVINHQKINELTAELLPALLSSEFATEYLQNINLSHQGDTVHPSDATIAEWLKKICKALSMNKFFTYFDIFYSHE